MTTDKKTAPQTSKTVRVRVLKHRLRVGDFFYPEGGEIDSMLMEEFEIRKKDGEVELIAVNA